MLPHSLHPSTKRTAPGSGKFIMLRFFTRYRAFNVVPFSAKGGAALFVQATRWVFAFAACPSTSHRALQKNSGAEAPEDLAHRLRLKVATLCRSAVAGMRERIRFHATTRTAAALAGLAASVLRAMLAVNGADMLHMARVVMHDVAAVLALGAFAAFPLFRFPKDFGRDVAAFRVIVKITLGVVFALVGRFRLTVLGFAATGAVLAGVMRAMNASGGDFMNTVVLVVFVMGHCPVP
jgi:hypothetical protein